MVKFGLCIECEVDIQKRTIDEILFTKVTIGFACIYLVCMYFVCCCWYLDFNRTGLAFGMTFIMPA